jgi:tetratricopeptide (TPR) repeat protein
MMVYDAFISYNHAKDSAVAARLQRLIQRLGKPWYLRRAARVFRDDTSLSATPHMWPTIVEALKASRFLILIASPESAASRWVFQETQYWLANKGPDSMLLALTAGELHWHPQANDFVWSEGTPLPLSLKGQLKHEPKWIDLRAFRDSAGGSAAELSAAADLAAAVRGIPKEDLLSEEVRQHRRAMSLSTLAAACLLLLSIAAGWEWRQATVQREIAITQRDRAEKSLLATVAGANDLVLTLAVKLRQTLGVPTAIVNEFLQKVGSLQDNLTKYNASSVDLERAKAVTLRAQSQALFTEGDLNGALADAEQSSQVLEALLQASKDDQGLNSELSYSLDREGEALSALGRHADALKAFRRALTTRQLLALSAQTDATLNAVRQRELATALTSTGDEYFALQQYSEASDLYQESLKKSASLAKLRPDDPNTQEDVAVGYDRIARIRLQDDDGDATISSLDESIKIRERLTKQDPMNSRWQENLAINYDTVGALHVARKEFGDARDALQKSLEIRQVLASRGPDVPVWQGAMAATLFYLAQCNDQPRERLQHSIDIVNQLGRDGKLSGELSGLREQAQSLLKALPQ